MNDTMAFPATLGKMTDARTLNVGSEGESGEEGATSISTGYLIFKRRR